MSACLVRTTGFTSSCSRPSLSAPYVPTRLAARPCARSPRWKALVVRATSDEEPCFRPQRAQALASGAAAIVLAAGAHLSVAPALATMFDGGLDPSPLELKLKPRTQEIIIESKAEHDGVDYSNEDLTGAIFGEASFRDASFRGSDLRAAVFTRSVLFKADLSGTDMSDAFFDYAVLRGADLSGSILQNTNLIRSDLGDAKIENADFTDALVDKYELKRLCQYASGTNPATGVDTRESLNCEFQTYYSGFDTGGSIKAKDAAR